MEGVLLPQSDETLSTSREYVATLPDHTSVLMNRMASSGPAMTVYPRSPYLEPREGMLFVDEDLDLDVEMDAPEIKAFTPAATARNPDSMGLWIKSFLDRSKSLPLGNYPPVSMLDAPRHSIPFDNSWPRLQVTESTKGKERCPSDISQSRNIRDHLISERSFPSGASRFGCRNEWIEEEFERWDDTDSGDLEEEREMDVPMLQVAYANSGFPIYNAYEYEFTPEVLPEFMAGPSRITLDDLRKLRKPTFLGVH